MAKSAEFHISASRYRVEAWSAWALPFDHLSAEQCRFRAELRNAIGCLEPCSRLHATYTAVSPRGPDLENLLFYNVGLAAFAKVGGDLIRFERVKEPPSSSPGGDQLPHQVCYMIEREDVSFPPIDGAWLAESHADFPSKEAPGVRFARLWKEFKKNLNIFADRGLSIGRFAVQITVTSSRPNRPHLVTNMKRLIDAFVSALHSYSGEQFDQVAYRLAAVLQEEDENPLRELLRDPQRAILEPRAMPNLWGATLQWSPADDRLVAAEISRVPGSANNPASAYAKLFGVP